MERKNAISCLYLVVALMVLGVALGKAEAGPAAVSADPYRTGNSDENKIALTCNVAWGEEFLPEMLEILDEKGVKITFNILGEWAEKCPEDLKRIAAAGHELGNHGYYHVNHSTLDEDRIIKEIRDTNALIYSLTGIEPLIFAPPAGDYSDDSVKAAVNADMTVVLWSVDTIDWRREGKEKILERVFRDPQAGDIILMHPVEDTVQALPEIIDGLRERGLEPCPVGEIVLPM